MSDDAETPTPEHEPTTSGLRRAMEDRMNQLQQAEDRLQREQSALQEQAKVVFAEREARLARRERELAKREAALAVQEGISAGNGSSRSGADMDRIASLEARLAELDGELETARQELEQAGPASPADADKAAQARISELQESVATLESQVKHEKGNRERVERDLDAAIAQMRDSGALGSAELAEREARLNQLEAELSDREVPGQEDRERAHPEGAQPRRHAEGHDGARSRRSPPSRSG